MAQNDKFQIQFTLNIPIKNFTTQTSRETELQKITLLPFDSHKLLCPVPTLKAYLLKTALVRKKVDPIFILFEDPPRPTSPATVSRWCKNLLRLAGVETYSIHSTRALASSNAVLSGIPLDTVVSLAGWVRASTFTHYYMKDLEKFVQNTDPYCSMFVKLWENLPACVKNPKISADEGRAVKKFKSRQQFRKIHDSKAFTETISSHCSSQFQRHTESISAITCTLATLPRDIPLLWPPPNGDSELLFLRGRHWGGHQCVLWG